MTTSESACPQGVSAESWKKLSPEAQGCVQGKLPKLIEEGYEPGQAYAIAVSMCERGTAKSRTGLGEVFGSLAIKALLTANAKAGACSHERSEATAAELVRKSSNVEKHVYWKRHRDDKEFFDRVEVVTQPRFKTSGLSGDEWRVSTFVKFFYKGILLCEERYHNAESAFKHMPWLLMTLCERHDDRLDSFTPEGKKRFMKDGLYSAIPDVCFQPGCAEKATTVYRLKKVYCDEGHAHEPDEWSEYRRAFCARHARRGDCALEDADVNYEVVSGGGPDDSAMRPGDERPSVFGGVIALAAKPDQTDPIRNS